MSETRDKTNPLAGFKVGRMKDATPASVTDHSCATLLFDQRRQHERGAKAGNVTVIISPQQILNSHLEYSSKATSANTINAVIKT
jgi:hypothetical protein